MAKIGFIGLGHMGGPMAVNLVKNGHSVQGFDLSEAALNLAVEGGVVAANNIVSLAEHADIVITMLQKGDQVKMVCEGANGLFAQMKPDSLFIDSSTIDVDTARHVHECAQQHNILMVDAPVSGGVGGASNATLTFMVGGVHEAYLEALPILECMGKTIIHAGGAGNGQAAKACNNMILAISMIAVSEGFNLAEKLGLDAKTFFDISSTASGQCWSMTSYCPAPGVVENAPSNNDYEAGFTANMMLKDLNLSQDAAASVDLTTPLGKAAAALYKKMVEEGDGEMDFSGIIKKLM